jgi:hypothetical protein
MTLYCLKKQNWCSVNRRYKASVRSNIKYIFAYTVITISKYKFEKKSSGVIHGMFIFFKLIKVKRRWQSSYSPPWEPEITLNKCRTIQENVAAFCSRKISVRTIKSACYLELVLLASTEISLEIKPDTETCIVDAVFSFDTIESVQVRKRRWRNKETAFKFRRVYYRPILILFDRLRSY